MKPLSEVVSVKESVEEELLKQPGVTGVDVGYKYTNGKRTDEIAIRVSVAKKTDKIPADQKLPPEIDGVKTDVIERTFELHQFSNRKKLDEHELMADTGTYDPLKGGISIGPCRAIDGFVYTGTLGAIVKDKQTGKHMALSNFHVMCVDDGWAAGDKMTQPSRVDTGSCPGGVIGELQRAVLSSSVDGAVCSLTSSRKTACEIHELGKVAGTNSATIGMKVRKGGRTTGLTHGIVEGIALSVKVDYGDGIGEKILTNQIDIAPDTSKNPAFGQKGDSGSVVVDENRKVVGLYFAGASDGTGVANPISAVLSALDITMCVGPILKLKQEVKEFKDFKLEKIEIKERKEFKPEKLEVEGRKSFIRDELPKFTDGFDPFQPIEQPVGPFAGGAAPQLKKVEFKENKPEKWEGKDKVEKFEKPELKDRKELKPEIKDGKESIKPELKDHKLEVKEGKESLKPEIKDHKELKIEKIEKIENETEKSFIRDEIPKFDEGRPIDIFMPVEQPAAGPAAGSLKKSELKEIKNEKPEKSEFKGEAKDKIEKFEKDETKEKIEKVEKPEIKDHKEKNESKDRKDHKETKEQKDRKDHKENKPEVKEHKNEKFEIAEGPNFPVLDPTSGAGDAGDPGGSVDQRIAQLEEMVGQLTTFITTDMRPDLQGGALTREPDLGLEDEVGAQLAKDAADAAEAKFQHDTKPAEN